MTTCIKHSPGFSGLVKRQLEKARQGHAPIQTPHEGYAVLLEEVAEFWECVRAKEHDPISMLEELSQIGAMAQRIAEDVVEPLFPQPTAGITAEHLLGECPLGQIPE